MKIISLNLALLTNLCFLFMSCSENITENTSKSFWIDNPLDKEIIIRIDDQQLSIPALSGIDKSIDYGVHEISYNGHKAKFVIKPSHYAVVMNPTLSNYVIYAQAYYYDNSKAAKDRGNALLNEYSHEYISTNDSTKYIPIKVCNPLFIDAGKEQWHYDIATPIPDVIDTKALKNNNRLAGLKKKLFREKDFYKYMNTDIRLNKPKITKLDDLNYEPVIADRLLASDCPEAQIGLDSLKLAIRQIETSTTIEDFMEAYKPFENMHNYKLGLLRFVNRIDVNNDCPTRAFMKTRREINNRLIAFNKVSAWIIK